MSWYSRLFGATRRTPPPLRAMFEVVGKRHVVVMDGESVDAADDYRGVVTALARSSGGALEFDALECTEEAEGRRLVLRRGAAVTEGVVAGETDWIDGAGLLAILNRAVGDAAGRFVEFDAGYNDQSCAFAFVTPEQLARLGARRDRGLTACARSTEGRMRGFVAGPRDLRRPDDRVLARWSAHRFGRPGRGPNVGPPRAGGAPRDPNPGRDGDRVRPRRRAADRHPRRRAPRRRDLRRADRRSDRDRSRAAADDRRRGRPRPRRPGRLGRGLGH